MLNKIFFSYYYLEWIRPTSESKNNYWNFLDYFLKIKINIKIINILNRQSFQKNISLFKNELICN